MDDFLGKRRILEQICLRTYIRGYFLNKRGLVFIQLSVARENSFFNK